jgi:hypothetical protein
MTNSQHPDKTFLQGYWLKMHFDARLADIDSSLRHSFIKFLKAGAIVFPCLECRPHFVKYIQEHPIESEESMLKWTVDFHNAVNKRLGKPIVSMMDAVQMYSSGNIPGCKACNPNAHQEEASPKVKNRFVVPMEKIIRSPRYKLDVLPTSTILPQQISS